MPLLRFRNTHWLEVHKLVIASYSFQIWSFYRFLFWQKFKHHLNHRHLLDWSYLSELVWKNAQVKHFNNAFIHCVWFQRHRQWIKNTSWVIDLDINNRLSVTELQEARKKFLDQILALVIALFEFPSLSMKKWDYVIVWSILELEFIDVTRTPAIKYSSILFELDNFWNYILISCDWEASVCEFDFVISMISRVV